MTSFLCLKHSTVFCAALVIFSVLSWCYSVPSIAQASIASISKKATSSASARARITLHIPPRNLREQQAFENMQKIASPSFSLMTKCSNFLTSFSETSPDGSKSIERFQPLSQDNQTKTLFYTPQVSHNIRFSISDSPANITIDRIMNGFCQRNKKNIFYPLVASDSPFQAKPATTVIRLFSI